MNSRDLRDRMWAEAIDLLDRADRMQRQFFQPTAPARGRQAAWEPPVDVFETDEEVVIQVALPGVAAERLRVAFEDDVLSVIGDRPVRSGPPSRIRRLEIPHGRFERHLEMSGATLKLVDQEFSNGCLVLTFRKEPADKGAQR
jgi:HSP20 family protein